MKLKKGSRILGEDCIYDVVAVVWSTVYLRRVDGKDYDYTMNEVYESYRDISSLHYWQQVTDNSRMPIRFLLL